jgi:hypothetical protein
MKNKIVSFEKAIKLNQDGLRYDVYDGPWFYVTSKKLLQKYDRGSCTEIYNKGDRFYNDADSMVIEGDYIPAPSKKQAICFKLKRAFKKLKMIFKK